MYNMSLYNLHSPVFKDSGEIRITEKMLAPPPKKKKFLALNRSQFLYIIEIDMNFLVIDSLSRLWNKELRRSEYIKFQVVLRYYYFMINFIGLPRNKSLFLYQVSLHNVEMIKGIYSSSSANFDFISVTCSWFTTPSPF